MKHHIGDDVIIKSDLVEGGDYGTDVVMQEMLEFCGAKAVVVDISDGEYVLDVDKEQWYWTNEMLED